MRVEALRGVGVQSDVQRVRVVEHLQVFGGRGRPWGGERAVPALVARYLVVSRAAEETRDRRGDEPQRVAEPVRDADRQRDDEESKEAALGWRGLAPARTLPRPGEDAVCLALLDQAYPLRTAHHLARKHPVRFVMLVVYAAGLLFIFLMRRQD